MKTVLVIFSLMIVSIAHAQNKNYLELAKCKGEVLDGGLSKPTTFILHAEEEYYCARNGQKFKGLISEVDASPAVIYEAEVSTKNGNIAFFSQFSEEESGPTVGTLKFEIDKSLRSPNAKLTVWDEAEGTSIHTFTCEIVLWYMTCHFPE